MSGPEVSPDVPQAGVSVHPGRIPEFNGSADCDCMFNHHAQEESVNIPVRMRPGGSLARALYRKTIVDQQLRRLDKSAWYQPNLECSPSSLHRTFLRLDYDDDTDGFIQEAEEKSERIFTQLWHSMVKLLFGWLLTQTSLNGFLGRGSMFVFSTAQFGLLTKDHIGGRLLDIGAGDGAVTAKMAPLFEDVSVTEVSAPMRKILARRGYRILEIDDWERDGPWDFISCLNVLDRCARPMDLLKQIHKSLTPNGRAIIALVLPYHPYVEVGGVQNHQPERRLMIEGTTYEEQVASVISSVLTASGFVLERWSRLPYLCEGDLHQAYYWLSDAVFVVKKAQLL